MSEYMSSGLPNNKPTSLPLYGSLAGAWTPARLSKPW